MASQAGGKIVASLLAIGIIAASASVNAANESTDEATNPAPVYELGHGLRLGDTGFTLGGYAEADYQDLSNAAPRLSLSHMSLFLWWEGSSRLKFFSELDSEDTLATRYHTGAGERRYLALERIYFDYSFNDSLTLRTGKFLTPIGRWNLIHAAPLVWTTSRPLITRDTFPDNATGVMALGNIPAFNRVFDYTFYASVVDDPHKDPAQDPFSEAYGTHFNFPVTENTQIGVSYADFAQTLVREEHKQLLGLDFLWTYKGYELMSEADYVISSKGSQRSEKGGFVQGVAPLYAGLFAVARLETLRRADALQANRRWVLGLNYRTSQSISFKLEYAHNMRNDPIAPDGILSSVSVLF